MSGSDEAAALSRAEAKSLLAWWLDSGVDVGIAESPRNWLAGKKASPHSAEEAAQAPAPDLPAEVRHERVGAGPPETLEAFHEWLRSSAELPLFRAGAARALPHGPQHAEVMLVSGLPAPEDSGEGRPIGGAAWTLTERMLAAIGIAPEAAYVAGLTCFPAAGTRMSERETEACRSALLQQVALVGPKRLLLLGDAPAKLLVGAPLAQARRRVHRVGGLPAVVTFHPRHLLSRGSDKALAWRDLLLLIGETA